MKFDFTTLPDRRGMDALAVDGLTGGWAPLPPKDGFDVIPMWVADMNFLAVPTIPQAIADRVSHPLYGYFEERQEYYDAIIAWQADRNGVRNLTKEHIGYENGVLGGLISAMGVLCPQGGKVLVHSPTYIGFTGSLTNAGYEIVHSPLLQDSEGIWRMDLADMEEKLVQQQIHTAILCSPHNPCGRVWERWELEQAMELFRKHDVYVISDEIWSDILLDGSRHIPTQSVSDDARNRTVALYAPSKTFNLAGLIGSYHIIYNDRLRHLVRKQSSLCHYNSINLLSMYGLLGAYTQEGRKWVDELCQVLSANVDYVCGYIRDRFPGVTVSRPQGTYMLFVDCSDWCEVHGVSLDQVLQKAWDCGVAVQDGRQFHGPCHIRINLALPADRVREAMDRLAKYVFV